MAVKVGIDLGTTYSMVALMDEETGQAKVLKNTNNSYTTPSVIVIEDAEIIVGDEAKEELYFGNEETASFYKRNLSNDEYSVSMENKSYNATELSALFLKALIGDIEKQNQLKIESAVISVPAYFSHEEIAETLKAAEMADIKVLGTIHEPTAAALAYGFGPRQEGETVLFYDLGGGTFDATIAKMTPSGIDVVGSSGDSQLGGKDFDDALNHCIEEKLLEQMDQDQLAANPSIQAILRNSEKNKKRLSDFGEIHIPYTANGQKREISVTRDEFEAISEDLVERSIAVVEELLSSLTYTWQTIDKIVLVGGSSKMPMIRRYFKEKVERIVETGVNVDEAVAIGAAIKAYMTKQSGLLMTATELPNFTLSAISEVTAHSMGMVALNEEGTRYVNSVMIRKNSKIPAVFTKNYVYQLKGETETSQMEVYVLQGDQERPQNNIFVNKYLISDFVPDGKQTKVKVAITFQYDHDGLIHVTATQGKHPLTVSIDQEGQDLAWTDSTPATGYHQICLAIDSSGSMRGLPMTKAKEASRAFVEQLSEGVEMAVMSVADLAVYSSDFSTDKQVMLQGIDQVDAMETGLANRGNPFDLADRTMANGLIIVMADGVWSNQNEVIELAKKIHQKCDVVGIGFGSADDTFLKAISNLKGVGGMTDLEHLSQSLTNIAQVIASGSDVSGMKAL